MCGYGIDYSDVDYTGPYVPWSVLMELALKDLNVCTTNLVVGLPRNDKVTLAAIENSADCGVTWFPDC